MKKSVSINIRGILLYIEEDGYEVLQVYLHKINQYFAHYEGRKEIVEDIENRIAEIFLSKLNSYKQVIDLEDVQALIAQMGDVSDFEMIETEEELLLTKEAPQGKKLFRENKHKVIAGVAGGLASYFGVRDLLLRILLCCLYRLGAGTLALSAALVARACGQKYYRQGSHARRGHHLEQYRT
ncbi:MAG: PspC domain-containing protein [Saprospiraceae bacterium]|nr:PspC domain-containing protein [Saprospiraceae bacterium]